MRKAAWEYNILSFSALNFSRAFVIRCKMLIKRQKQMTSRKTRIGIMCFYSEVELCFPEKSWNGEIHVSVEKLSFSSMKIWFWLENGIWAKMKRIPYMANFIFSFIFLSKIKKLKIQKLLKLDTEFYIFWLLS